MANFGFEDPPGRAGRPEKSISYEAALAKLREQRRRAVRKLHDEEGKSLREIGRALGIDPSTAMRDLQATEQAGADARESMIKALTGED